MSMQEGTAERPRISRRAPFVRPDPIALLERLFESYPNDTDRRAVRRFMLEGGDDMIAAALEPWLTKRRQIWRRDREANKPEVAAARQAAIQADRAAIREQLTEHIRTEARVMLLDIVMPNGKRLRDCRGTECVKMGKVHIEKGSWWIAIGQKAGKEKVGDVLSEAQVAKLKAA